jgi:DNA topoisomerase VI subunit A
VGISLIVTAAPRSPTRGPKNRYCNILFIEKEGFMPLFRAVRLAERYDIAIMSTKGMSVTAAREYIDELFGRFDGLRFFVLHDFDKSGFSIAGTLKRDTKRYSFKNLSEDDVVDLGLRMDDIAGLQDEDAPPIKDSHAARWNLQENGATEQESTSQLRS